MDILSYSDYVVDEHAIRSEPGEPIDVRMPRDAKAFFTIAKQSSCPFCRRRLRRVFVESGDLRDGDEGDESNAVFECGRCGWWEYEYYCRNEGALWQRNHETKRIYWGIIKRYKLSSNAVPLRALRQTVLKQPHVLYKISARKMEELVRYCFQSYYDCEVKHCGKSHDGGVDLVVVLSDEPILVQVKRHESDRKSEPVDAVREFLGAMLINRSKSGIYVTNARKFSRQVVKVRDKLIQEETVQRFDLIDYNRFVSMLQIARPHRPSVSDLPWYRLLETLQTVRDPWITDWYKSEIDTYGVGRHGIRARRSRIARKLARDAPIIRALMKSGSYNAE